MPDDTPTGSTSAADTPDAPPAGSQGTPAPTVPPADQPKTFGEDYVRDLRKESAGYRTRAVEAERALSAAETDLAKIPELQNRASTAEAQALRYRVALEKGLSLALADRLKGDDAEALAADAETLKGLLGNQPPVDFDQGGRTPPPQAGGMNEALRALAFGRPS